MKIAIFHHYFDEIGGAEITLLYMARGLNAPIYTTNIDRENIDRLGFKDVKIISIGKVPNIRYLKQMATQLRFSFLKIGGFDLYIFGGCFSIHSSRNHKPNLWYCFSPLRRLYDLRDFKRVFPNLLKQPIRELQICLDQIAVRQIQKIVSPSANVKRRVLIYYKRDSEIIYSPISTSEFRYKAHANYWLSVLRIDPYKRIELQIEAFSKIPEEKLIIVGGAASEFDDYLKTLKTKSPQNVSFYGPIFDRDKLCEIYANCKGFIATAKDEDFGMTPVEAMASGKPVIAPNEGGYKETVIDGITGRLIDDIDVEKLVLAIKEIGKNPAIYKDASLEQAKRFDTKVFIDKIKSKLKNEIY